MQTNLSFLCGVLAVFVWNLGSLATEPIEDSAKAVQIESAKRQIVYLHTEFNPIVSSVQPNMTTRLHREIVRQAFILAANHELGVAVRDATLAESMPTNSDEVEVVRLALFVEKTVHRQTVQN